MSVMPLTGSFAIIAGAFARKVASAVIVNLYVLDGVVLVEVIEDGAT